MTDRQPTFELLLQYLDNDLPSDERTDVEDLLRTDPAAREMFREIAQQAVIVADVARVSSATHVEKTGDVSRNPRGRLAGWHKLLLAVAAIALFAATLSLLGRTGEREVVTIKALNGHVEWIGSGGRVTEELAVGTPLPGGTIELLSADSWVEFQFHDESTVTLSGQSAVTISEQKQKELHLRYGSLSANVRPQPADYPLLVHTPSAELMVLGTQFNVDALPDSTRLAVNKGRVRLKRLTDGREVDVPAKYEVTASMEDLNGLPLSARGRAVSIWKSDLGTDVVRGKWLSDHWILGMRLKKAVASGEMNEADAIAAYKNAAALNADGGSVWADASPYGSLVQLAVAQSSATPVVLSGTSSLRIKGRLHSGDAVKFGITTKKSSGGFGGKYSVFVEAAAMLGDGNSFEIELPLSTFDEVTEFGDSLVGKELSDWWCVAESTSAKFEITSVELIE